METVTALWAVFTAAAAVIYWFMWVMGAAEVKGKRVVDLKMGFITRDMVQDKYKQYWPFFRRPKETVSSSTQIDETVFVGDENVPLEGVIQFDKPSGPSKLLSWVGILAGGNVLCLLLFEAIGRFNHGMSAVDFETARTVDPFVAGWLLSAYFVGAYGDDAKGVNGLAKAIVAAAKSLAVGIQVVTMGLVPAKHLGKELAELQSHLLQMKELLFASLVYPALILAYMAKLPTCQNITKSIQHIRLAFTSHLQLCLTISPC